ncbi:hypothetical protein WCE37_03405 [Luteimonas sp. MJ250]|uniref:hypothetical protein n=1 Tax=Luteimonas sp. MJ250 TaxID=3129236 RepID=UPI0031BAA90C
MTAAHRPFRGQEALQQKLAEREITLYVRSQTVANARRMIDWPAQYPEGRKMLREHLRRGKATLRDAASHDLEDVLWAGWLVDRIEKALAKYKRKQPTPKAQKAQLASIERLGERVASLTGMVALDPHKGSPQQNHDDIREANWCARRLLEYARGER